MPTNPASPAPAPLASITVKVPLALKLALTAQAIQESTPERPLRLTDIVRRKLEGGTT
jgi:hypothetical protein